MQKPQYLPGLLRELRPLATLVMTGEEKEFSKMSLSEDADVGADQRGSDSGTDEDIPVVGEKDDSMEEPLPVEYPGTVLPDLSIQEIDTDADLAQSYESDTTYIDLINLRIRHLEDLNLGRFTHLESLCLRQNLIESISDTRDLPDSVEDLDFYDNRINHISSSIKHLVNLRSFDLSFNNIKTIKNLETLTQLTDLYFVQNRIREIKNLDTLTKLRNLELGGNKVEKLENLDLLVGLEQLWVGKNKIPRLENLDCVINLRVLSIQSNRLTKIEGLDKLVNLEELYLSHNAITKIENLTHNTKLNVLDVTSNRISTLENLDHLTALTDFWCSYNQVSSFKEVESQLSKLPELDTVYFEGNPLQTENPTAYRRKLRLCLGPSLAKIDATYVHG